jgi:hypothetical protein
MRLVHLSADPPDNLSSASCGEYGDPGNYAFNARSKVVFGDWKIEELGAAPFSPVPHFVTYLFFLLFGTGIGQMNLVPFFFSVLLYLALFLLSSRYFPEARLLFLLLLVLNYPFGSFNRINDQVMPMTFFVILAIYFFLKAWERPPAFFWAALCLSFSFLSKPKILYFHLAVLPVAFLLILVERREVMKFKLNFRRLAYFFGGALLIAVPWFFFVFQRYPTVFKNVGELNAEFMLPLSPGQALANWVQKPAFSFYPTNRLLTIVIFFYLLALLIALFSKNKKDRITPLEILCSTWLVVGLGINSVIGYRPIRHFIEFTIPLLILVGIFITRLLGGFRLDGRLKKRGLFFAGIFILVWAAASSYSQMIFPLDDIAPRKDKLLLHTLLLSLALAALLYLVLNRVMQGKGISLSQKGGLILTVVFVSIYAYQNVAVYLSWVKSPTYKLKTISHDLGRAFPRGVFSGLLIPTLSLENRNRAHTSWPRYANDDPGFLGREGVTHLFLGTYNNELRYYVERFPEETERARLLVRYRIWRSWFDLYDIQEGPRPDADETVYEAETMDRETGLPLFDPQAGGRFAVRVETDSPKVIGHRKIVLPGQTKFRGRLYVKPASEDTRSLVLLVKLTKRGKVAYQKKLQMPGPEDAYLSLPFDFVSRDAGRYTLEIRASGKGVFFFDKVEMEGTPRSD